MRLKFALLCMIIGIWFVACPIEPDDTSSDDLVISTKPVDPANHTNPTNPTNPANPANPINPGNPANPANPTRPTIPIDSVDSVDSALWFGEINRALVMRIGDIDSDAYTGQAANYQDVCDVINAQWDTSFSPELGTETQIADVEYLLNMIDKANNNATIFGNSNYATAQVVDAMAVNDTVSRLLALTLGPKFVAVGYSGAANGNNTNYGNRAVYSVDGETWNATILPSHAYWHSVCYGNGKFVAVADSSSGGSNKAAYSDDGIIWTETTLPSNENWKSVCYGNGKFVAVGDNIDDDEKKKAYAACSVDGINWTKTAVYGDEDKKTEIDALPCKANWQSVCYGNGKFVAIVGNFSGSNKAAYSDDGIKWKEAKLPSYNYWRSVCYGNGKFVAIAYDNNNKVAYSVNGGKTWEEATLPSNAYWQSISYGDGKFVAVSDVDSFKMAYSADGINWTDDSITFKYYIDDIEWTGISSKYDIDGFNLWTDLSTLYENLFSICYGNGQFVAVGNNSAVYSTDGITWNVRYSGVCSPPPEDDPGGKDKLIKLEPLLPGASWRGVCYGGD